MPRHVRQGDDPAAAPSIDNCLAHRCAEHREMLPVDDSADSGAECGICVGVKFVEAHEQAAEEEILKRLFWPMVERARDRMNLLSHGTGYGFEEEARELVVEFSSIYQQAPPDVDTRLSDVSADGAPPAPSGGGSAK
jgi:hypothetical protein